MTDPKMEVSTTPLVPEEQEFKKLYGRLKPIIWLLDVRELKETSNEVKQNEYEVTGNSEFTGFTVSKGLIMTCAHTLISKDTSKLVIYGRKMDEIGYNYTLKIHNIQQSWDCALLTVSEGGLKDCMAGEFAQDDFLEKGETVMMFGHPYSLLESCLLGSVAYNYHKDVTLPLHNDSSTCKDFKSDACDKTQRYRKMGHLYNDDFFNKYGDEGKQFDKLHPNIPIIQINGLRGNPGTSGAPIFNNRGKVLGMEIMGINNFDIAIHATLLQHFVSLPESKLNEDTALGSDELLGKDTTTK